MTAPGAALKETCRVVAGRPFPDAVPLWPWHRARLKRGGCGPGLLALAEQRAAAAVASWAGPPGPRIRLTIVVTPEGAVDPAVERRLSSLDVPGGPAIAIVHVDRSPYLPAGPAKPADRSEWDAAQAQARRLGAHQALLVTPDGLIVDGATASVWLVIRGRLVTPPSPPAVPGVARAWVLERAPELGLAAKVGPVRPEDLDLAEEVVLTNAFAGAVAARGRGGPVSERLRGAFDELWGRR